MLAHSKLISNLRFLLKFGPQSLKRRLDLRGNTVRNNNHKVIKHVCKFCEVMWSSCKNQLSWWWRVCCRCNNNEWRRLFRRILWSWREFNQINLEKEVTWWRLFCSDVVLDKLCKECGKGFQSRKALFGTWIGIEIKKEFFFFFLNTEIYYKPNTT